MPLSSSKDLEGVLSDQSKNNSSSSSDTYSVYNDSEITTRGISLQKTDKL